MTSLPNIIVCGDIMLDHNIFTDIEKIANEAPIPVFNRYKDEHILGGCGNVIKNLSSLGCNKLYSFSVIGNDSNGKIISRLLDEGGVINYNTVLDSFSTTTKQRYFCSNKIVFRCDTENKKVKGMLESVSFIEKIEHLLKTEKIQCIVLSDYNKGVLHEKQCKDIISLANNYGVFTCVDPKEDYHKYIGCSLIKPNLKEAYVIFKYNASSIDLLHKHIYDEVKCKYSVITMAEKGITLYDGTTLLHEIPVIHKIIDVTGAGDIVCCILAYFLSQGMESSKVVKLATRIATKSIEYPGTYTLTKEDVQQKGKIISIEEFTSIRRDSPIVFTNGCFDLLHSGHIELFKFCKAKGTVIVGLNSDDSIRRLKGQNRPVNALKIRLDILESIQYIDYIVVFDDDTPYNLIKELCPDYLIKGGDYDVSTIVGREFSKETIVCDFVNGYSSTSIINKIRS